MTSILDKLTAIFRAVFEDDTFVMRPDTTAIDVREWDSLSHIRLVLCLEKAFGVALSPERIASAENAEELAHLIQAALQTGRPWSEAAKIEL